MKKELLSLDPIRLSGRLHDDVNAFSAEPNRWRISMRARAWRPPTDVYERETEVIVRMEIAGMKDEDFSISLADRSLIIRGVRPDVSERRAFHQMEIFFGEFVCEIELPCAVIAEEVSAEYQRGFLRIMLPKQKSKKVHIED